MQVNSLTSLVSDICWAYAMLLTTPLVVTVGLSLTIPLSLVGQMILQAQYASPLYWVGATVVFLSFLVVNHESRGEMQNGTDHAEREREGQMENQSYEAVSSAPLLSSTPAGER